MQMNSILQEEKENVLVRLLSLYQPKWVSNSDSRLESTFDMIAALIMRMKICIKI